jgi:hypothetical protein
VVPREKQSLGELKKKSNTPDNSKIDPQRLDALHQIKGLFKFGDSDVPAQHFLDSLSQSLR